MSRQIQQKTSVSITEEERQLRKPDMGRLLFTVYRGRRCALYIQNNRLTAASFFPEKPSRIGAVYIGKVKNMAKNIDACFVEIAGGEICFLSLKDTFVPYLLNRDYNGRLVEGDEILVQVVKDSHNTKKASVTTQISLANDSFSLSLDNRKAGFSSKLSKERKQELKELLTKKSILQNGYLNQDISSLLDSLFAMPQYGASVEHRTSGLEGLEDILPKNKGIKLPPIGCVVRTKAGEESESELLRHFFSIAAQFIRLLYTAKYRSCFSCLKEAPADFEAVFQQFPLESGSPAEPGWEIVTDLQALREPLAAYCKKHEINVNVRLYQDDMLSLSVLYSIESRLETALASRVWLKSGGYLVIEPTEAMTVIDVNTGKYEAGKNPQETYLKINLQAAEEIAIQLRLRNLSGIIIVDFINMQSAASNKELLNRLKELVIKDKVLTNVVDMTPLGLVEITRKKINKPLREQFQVSGGASQS